MLKISELILSMFVEKENVAACTIWLEFLSCGACNKKYGFFGSKSKKCYYKKWHGNYRGHKSQYLGRVTKTFSCA